MFEAYKIGTTLTINNEVPPVIMRLTEEFTKLQKLSQSVTRSFEAIGKSSAGIDRLARSVQNLNNQLSNTIKRGNQAAAAMAGMGAGASFGGATARAAEYAAAAATGASAGAFYPPAMAPGTGWQYGRGGGSGMPPVYGAPMGLNSPGGQPRFGYSSHLEGEYTRVYPGAPPGGFTGPPRAPGGWWNGSGGWSPRPGSGGPFITGYGGHLAEVAGVFGGAMLGTSAVRHSAAYDQEATRLKLYGMDALNNRDAMGFADSMNIPGVDRIHALKFFTEAQGVFRESGLEGKKALDAAKLAAPFLAKIHASTAALGPEGQAMSVAKGLSMLRFIEMAGGLNSPEKFNQIANQGWKMTQTSGGAVDWEQLRQFMARAQVSGQGLTPLAFAKLEPELAELKGSTAGFGLRTAFNRLNGIIKLPNQVAHLLADNGIWDASKVEWNKNGGIKKFKGNPMRNGIEFSDDPVGFYMNHIEPMYKKQGITNVNEIGRMNAMIFGSTGGGLFNLIHRQMETIKKSVEAQNKALGINESLSIAVASKQGQLNTVTQKYSDLLTKLGNEIFPAASAALNVFIVPLKLIGKMFEGYNLIGRAVADTPGLGSLVGRSTAYVAAAFGSQEAKDALHARGDDTLIPETFHIKPRWGGGNVYLDGKKVGAVMTPHVTKEQSKQANRPQQGTTRHDGNMSMSPVGAHGGF